MVLLLALSLSQFPSLLCTDTCFATGNPTGACPFFAFLQVLTVRSQLAETREELRGTEPDIMEVLAHLWPTLAVVGGVSPH